MEQGLGYKGIRLFLSKVREEDSDLLHSIRRGNYASEPGEEEKPRLLVFFKVERVLPLIGDSKDP
jgi:hypothetical protein